MLLNKVRGDINYRSRKWVQKHEREAYYVRIQLDKNINEVKQRETMVTRELEKAASYKKMDDVKLYAKSLVVIRKQLRTLYSNKNMIETQLDRVRNKAVVAVLASTTVKINDTLNKMNNDTSMDPSGLMRAAIDNDKREIKDEITNDLLLEACGMSGDNNDNEEEDKDVQAIIDSVLPPSSSSTTTTSARQVYLPTVDDIMDKEREKKLKALCAGSS